MSISALDVNTVKLITTTQIITSVYAVVKELIENSIDADADNIEINLVDNGTSLIEIKDNGYGISKEDAPYMGLPSHTSKISNFEDLDALQSFGYRGEALSAICAVAEVIIITKTKEDNIGNSYTMNYSGQVVKCDPCLRSTGTTVQVRNLFKQVPVRRQIITNTKKANQCIKLLKTLIQSFGMCKPNIRIQFKVNNNITFMKPCLNNIKEAVNYILGRKIMSNMEWIEYKNEEEELTFQIMLPSRKVQDLSEISHPDSRYIFVNNRPIRHKDLEKLINNLILQHFEQESYRKKMVFLVYLILKPIDIDVNLEPNKNAVLFKEQNKVLNAIDKCIRKFYGLKSEEIIEQDVCNDTSVCYEDYISNFNETVTDWPTCKKRKIHVQEKDIQHDNVKKKSTLNNDIGYEISPEQNDNQIHDEKHYKDTLTHIQSPNLSDSDSNDTFASTSDKTAEEGLTLSQLPVVDLGEDFNLEEIEKRISINENKSKIDGQEEKSKEDLTVSQPPVINFDKDFDFEEIGKYNISVNKNDDKINIQKEKQLEAWSKGHVTGIKGGTEIRSDIAIERQSDSLGNKIDKVSESPHRAHVDRKNLNFLKHVGLQVSKENPTLTVAQTAKKITDFWKQLSSEERGYYRDIAREEENEHQTQKKTETKTGINKVDLEKNKSRLLQLFEKMKNSRNEKKEKLNMRTIVPWIIDRANIITRSSFDNEHIIGQLTSTLWVATICEQIWIVDIIGLIKGLKVIDVDADKIDAKKIECLLKQWLVERDDMSVMHSIHEFTRKK